MKYILALFLLVPFTGFAQKITEDKIDEFNGTRMIITSNIPTQGLGLTNSVYGMLQVKREDTTLMLAITYKANLSTTTNQGSLIQLRLENGSVIDAVNLRSYKIVLSGELGSVFFKVTPEIKEALKGHKVVKYRIDTSNEKIDVPVKEKNQGKFTDIINLLEDRVRK